MAFTFKSLMRIAALWEDDGVSLLPQAKPLVGKAAIVAMLDEVTRQHRGAKMRVSVDFAHEYCDEHQIVDLGADQPPFEGRAKLLFVLHRSHDGVWRIRREMWNQG